MKKLELALPIAFILVLAGCLSGGDKAPEKKPEEPTANLLKFANITTIAKGGAAVGEPSLLVDNDGRIFVSGPGGAGLQGSPMWISTDNGTKWISVTPNTHCNGGGDTSLAIAPDGSVYVTDLWVGNSAIAFTHDHGKTWDCTPLSSTSGYYDREWNMVDSDNVPWVLARSFDPAPTAYISKSLDKGLTWVTTGVAWVEPRPGGATFGTLDPNQDGPFLWNIAKKEMAVVYTCNADYKTICVTTSKDGTQWSAVVGAENRVIHRDVRVQNIFPVMAIDTEGTYYVAWADASDGQMSLWLSYAKDGKTWSPPVKVNQRNGTHLLPWIVAGDPGRLDFAWYGTDVEGDNNKPSDMSDAEWHVYFSQSLNANTATPNFTEIKITRESVHEGSLSTQGFDPTTPQPDRALLDFLNVAIDPYGYAHLVFAKGNNNRQEATLYAHQIAGESLWLNGPKPIWR